jgi:Family of unknown function (DUF6307)
LWRFLLSEDIPPLDTEMRVEAVVSASLREAAVEFGPDEQRRQPIRGVRSIMSSAFSSSEHTRRNRKETMTSESTVLSPYEKRIGLVRETLQKYSSLDDVAAGELAVRVLHALNSIPEKVR